MNTNVKFLRKKLNIMNTYYFSYNKSELPIFLINHNICKLVYESNDLLILSL